MIYTNPVEIIKRIINLRAPILCQRIRNEEAKLFDDSGYNHNMAEEYDYSMVLELPEIQAKINNIALVMSRSTAEEIQLENKELVDRIDRYIISDVVMYESFFTQEESEYRATFVVQHHEIQPTLQSILVPRARLAHRSELD